MSKCWYNIYVEGVDRDTEHQVLDALQANGLDEMSRSGHFDYEVSYGRVEDAFKIVGPLFPQATLVAYGETEEDHRFRVYTRGDKTFELDEIEIPGEMPDNWDDLNVSRVYMPYLSYVPINGGIKLLIGRHAIIVMPEEVKCVQDDT